MYGGYFTLWGVRALGCEEAGLSLEELLEGLDEQRRRLYQEEILEVEGTPQR